MNATPTLDAIKTLVSASFPRTYIYPTDYASMALKPACPFVVIEEDTGNLNAKAKLGSALCAFDSWQVRISVFSAEQIQEYPSTKNATSETAARTDRDTVMGILDANKTYSNTVQYSGDDTNRYTHAIVPLQWNRQENYTGSIFLIPVQT